MAVYIGECPLGVFAFDEDGKMIESKTFPRDVEEIAGRLSLICKGVPTEEHRELLEEVYARGYRKFSVASKQLASELSRSFKDAKFEIEVPGKANKALRSSLQELSDKFGFGNVNDLLREVNLSVDREKMRREASQKDKLVIQAVGMLDELDKSINTFYGRIREWYGIHFPELERYISECPKYFELVSKFGSRENFTKSALKEAELSDETAEKIAQAAASSVGSGFDEIDVNAFQRTVDGVKELYNPRKQVVEYIEMIMSRIAPNIQTLVGGSIGARLISLAGGLKKLARMPASTIQVLGAEKALFRFLQGLGKSPKHGVIFQYPDIRGSPNVQRGKIARALANKLAIASRVDAMSGTFVGDKLKEDLETRISSIKSEMS